MGSLKPEESIALQVASVLGNTFRPWDFTGVLMELGYPSGDVLLSRLIDLGFIAARGVGSTASTVPSYLEPYTGPYRGTEKAHAQNRRGGDFQLRGEARWMPYHCQDTGWKQEPVYRRFPG